MPWPHTPLRAALRSRHAAHDCSAAVQRRGVPPAAVVWPCALWIAGPGNWPLWQAVWTLPELGGPRGLFLCLALGTMIAAALAALLGLLAWRATLAPAIGLVLLAAACGAHFMGRYGIVIDPGLMGNVFGTDTREARDLLSAELLLSVMGLAVLPAWRLRRLRIAYGAWARRAGRNLAGAAAALAVLAAALLLAYPDVSATMREHKQLRYLINPLNSFYALGRVAWRAGARPAGPPQPIGLDAAPLAPLPGQRPPLLLLVVGETARADHFALNGYARDTTPELRAAGVLSFRHVTSCGTHTAASLPCMLSHLGRARHEGHIREHENLLDLLQRAGLAVLWVENQAGCKQVCDRVPHTRPQRPAPGAGAPGAQVCPGGECLDEALLLGLDERLAALPAQRRARGVVLVLHQMGSHGPAYAARSPVQRKPFQPECHSAVLRQCSREELVNAYDNSIAYTDHVLAGAIAWLETHSGEHDPALLYLSDHGESLGENGIYLHGLPYALAPSEQTQVPMVLWLSEQTRTADRLDAGCLQVQRDARLSHDHLFHTVLGLARVGANEYRPALDALAACRSTPHTDVPA